MEKITEAPNVAAQVRPPSIALHHNNELSFRSVTPVDIAIRRLVVTVDGIPSPFTKLRQRLPKKIPSDEEVVSRRKTILGNISADLPRGTLTAIIGGSGSGKTTLLNVVASRVNDSRLNVSGSVTFNGNHNQSGVQSAYVMQQDVLISSLTVRETLQYSADLRLKDASTKVERQRIVEEVILELSLKEAADTRVMYCSGGEKRRTSLAIQLLSNPSVLWLDEPTTGLDATSAFHLITTLEALARKGRTIITTIHQPRSEIWSLFDRVILLTQGSCAYSGPAAECIPYFSSLGYPLPPFCNPAEHIIDAVAVDTRSDELESASSARVESLKEAWRDRSADLLKNEQEKSADFAAEAIPVVEHHLSTKKVPLARQLRVLTARTALVTVRDPMGLLGTFIEAVFMGIVCGWIFYKLDGSLAGIRSRQGAMYVACALQGYLILMFETYRVSLDIELFDRERNEGVVSVPAFLISRRLAKVIEDIPVPFVFSLIFYFMTGFRHNGAQFMIFFAVIVIEQYIAVCLAVLCVALSRDFAIASLIGNLAYTWQTFGCGFFIAVQNLPVYLKWSKWTAYVFYAFGALSTNEFANHSYGCPFPGGDSNSNCLQYSGNFQLRALGIPTNWIWRPILVLVSFTVFIFVLSGITLSLIRHEIRLANTQQGDADKSAGKERMAARSVEELRTVSIQLEDYRLDVQTGSFEGWKWRSKTMNILKPVNTTFKPGTLNVVMGPSGSGKTSLLCSMARRLHNDLTSRYDIGGKLLFNGAEPSKPVLQSIVSFVTQDDDALLPSLTVRETLKFAAGLRLPKWMSKTDKNRRAEEVLLKMGLKDCANNLIGSPLVKGISGGEKRRVTIAIQILTDPRILLLDEPTSGLDGFTAASIMEVLKGLADEGRTLVMTIHQSRSDLWQSFGNILLLARGGHPVYAGERKHMLKYFTSKGFECPETTNPADFALDLITIDLRHADREAATREKVQALIEGWNENVTSRPSSSVIATPAELGALQKTKATFFIAFPILLHRSMLNLWRQPPLMIGRIMQVVGLGLVAALFFSPLKHDYYSIQSRLGFIQQVSPLYFVGMLQNVAVYPFEQAVFYREHDDRAYDVEAFLLQYTLLEVPFEIITGLLFAILCDFAISLPRTAPVFFVIAFNCFCLVSCGESLGILFNTLFSHTGFAVNVTSIFLSLAQIMGGTMSINIPGFLQALNHLSPVKYSIASLAVQTLKGQRFTCLDSQKLPNGHCPQETGEQVLKLYGLNQSLKTNLLALGGVTIGYRLLAYVILKAKRENWHRIFKRNKRTSGVL